ncbi:TonB-dependent receptor [Pseudomaricurvus alkylphenolicus]|uniref:TonB-dependent receptor n=1 Tax=Pseudomaricurvus alkylphenolicus TaxID=1306991 RepID=UPI00142190C0|nr:TonB-dependent receptor [Pseudomaricurvus alkylphenolicus]NIB40837.1 TonB-dependent receptor [Pseudomaricurvus alkylphenolicus]
MYSNFARLNTLALAIGMLGSPVTLALPQNTLAIEELVVTARKMEESLQDTPIAVSAFSAADLENRGTTDLTDIGAAAPNVSFEGSAAVGGMKSAPTVFIRGIGQADFTINSDPAVGVYVDGIYMGRSLGSLVDLLDIERAEVLRGPQGTLFGRNSIGGAINLVTTKPETENTSADISVSIGNDGYIEAKAKANLPLSEDLAARFATFSRQRDGYVKALQYDDLYLGEDDVWGVSATFRYEPTSDLTIDFALDYSEVAESPSPTVPTNLGNVADNSLNASGAPIASRFNSGTPFPPPLPQGYISSDFTSCSTAVGRQSNRACYGNIWIPSDRHAVNSVWTDSQGMPIEPVNRLNSLGGSLAISWESNLGTVTSISGFRKFDANFYNDLDYTPYVIFHNINDTFEQEQFSQEVQLLGSLSDSVTYIAGIYYFRETGLQSVSLVAPLLPPAFNFDTLPLAQTDFRNIENTSKAVFGQLTWQATEALQFTLGLRYTEDDKYYDYALMMNNQLQQSTGLQSAHELTPLLSLSYNLSHDTMVYASYTEGFRDGGFPGRFPGGMPDALPSYDPEYVSAIEMGIKSSWLDDRLRLNAAVFQTNYEDIQVTASSPALSGAPAITNLAEATLRGLELEVTAIVTENLKLEFAGGYLDDTIESVVGDRLTTGGGNTTFFIDTSSELPNTPKWNFNLGLSHFKSFTGGGALRSRLDWIWTDDQYFRIENTEDMMQQAYSRLNASVTYLEPMDRWDLTLGVRNLTDKDYSTAGGITTVAGSNTANVSRPRELYLKFQYHFGQ